MSETKEFSTEDVLSVVTGRVVSERLVLAFYDVLGWMSGEALYTHQIPRLMKEARPVIIAAHPIFASAIEDAKRITRDNWREWVNEWVNRIGPAIDVPRLKAGEHECIDPLDEAEKLYPNKIIAVGGRTMKPRTAEDPARPASTRWIAVGANLEPGLYALDDDQPIGQGATELEAVADLERRTAKRAPMPS